MEVLRPAADEEVAEHPEFVINVGASEKIRHDALTDILELLNARYKLAQTVLFHRTKLALTGLLDRCLLEIASLYDKAGLPSGKFAENVEEFLLDASDDSLALILEHLLEGGDSVGKKQLAEAIKKEESELEREIVRATQDSLSSPQPTLIESGLPAAAAGAAKALAVPKSVIRGELQTQTDLARELIHKLRDRDVYSLVYKLRMSDFKFSHDPENPRLLKLLKTYKQPKKRLEFLQAMEALCGFPAGSLILNCPSDAAMNAKIAKVNLFVEGEVTSFDRYARGDSTLTRGALWAQIKRFYELWAANIYVDRRVWDTLSVDQREHLKSLLQEFFFQMDADRDPKVVRAQVQRSIEEFQTTKVSRAGSEDPANERWKNYVFTSGLPFSVEADAV